MKNLSAWQVQELTQLIFVSRIGEDQFVVLTDLMGNTFTDIHLAIEFIRSTNEKNVGLSTLEQALLGNAQWDNL